MNGGTLAAIRTLKDGHGNYLWQPSYQAGQPETILGRSVVEAVDMPGVDEDAKPIIFGDLKRGYRIYDRLSLAVLADPYTMLINGLMRYHARRRVGAKVVRPTAFRKLVMAVWRPLFDGLSMSLRSRLSSNAFLNASRSPVLTARSMSFSMPRAARQILRQ